MSTLKWAIIIFISLNIMLALIPGLTNQIQHYTDNLGTWTILLRFFFVPTEYVWKWIVGLLVAVVALFK